MDTEQSPAQTPLSGFLLELKRITEVNHPSSDLEGGYLVPCDFCREVAGATEAWLDHDFLNTFFPTSLALQSSIEALSAVRRAA